MNTITIQGYEYEFEEKTYTINKSMSFRVNLVRYTKDESVICLCLLKSLVINLNDKEENFRDFDKKLKVMEYLRYKENIELINNVSRDVNNKLYYNFVVESDPGMPGSDSTNITRNILLDNNHRINIDKLNKTCIITPNTLIENFKYIPIFHRNGPEKTSKSEVIVHFSILIDMLTKVYSEFKHLILKLSDIILNLTELQDKDLEAYMNMTTSDYIRLLKEKDNKINQYKKDKRILRNKLNKEVFKNKYRCSIVSEMKTKFFDDKFEELKKLHQKTIEEIRNNNFEAEQRHIETMNELKLDQAYTVATIEEHSKSNLNNTAKRCGSEAANV